MLSSKRYISEPAFRETVKLRVPKPARCLSAIITIASEHPFGLDVSCLTSAVFQEINSLDLRWLIPNTQPWVALQGFTNITKLEIFSLDRLDLQPVRYLSRLSRLELVCIETCIGLKYLNDLPDLRQLNISHVSELSLFGMNLLPSLQELIMSYCKSVHNLEFVQRMPSLKKLYIDSCSAEDLSPLGCLKNVEDLDLIYLPISSLNPLRNFLKLGRLSCFGCAKIVDLSPLAPIVRLKSLNIGRTGATDIQPLQNLVNLELLHMMETSVSNISALRTCLKLESIDIRSTEVSDVSPIEDIPGLQTLFIEKTKVKDLTCLRDHGHQLRVHASKGVGLVRPQGRYLQVSVE